MNLSAPFIKRPVMTSLIMSAVIFFGVFAYRALPVSDLPSVDYPTIEVNVSYPGASPETMANNVAGPLEREFTTIENVQTITSTNQTGSTTIVVQFTLDKNIDAAATEIQSGINQAQSLLPKDLPNNPTYSKVNPSQTPIIYYAITSDTMTVGKLYDYAYSFLGQRLGLIDGVSQIQVYGAPFAVRVQVDPDKLYAKKIGIDQVANVIMQGNTELATGVLYGPDTEYNINIDGQIFHAEGYNRLIVRNHNGSMVRVGDLGHAIDSLQDDKYSLTYQQGDKTLPCVVIGVRKEPNANSVKVIGAIKKLLPTLQKQLPGSVEIETIFDQSVYIFESVEDVQMTLLIAFFLVVLVILFYLGRLVNTLIPIVALPLSVIGTFIFLYLFGYNLDILSMLAITLSIGFLVDDAIVVLENIYKHLEEGKAPLEAALEGSREISLTIFSMTLCLTTVFIPMLFMGGIIGKIFREFSVTIMVAVIISGIISLTLTPLLCSRFLRGRSREGHKNLIEKLSQRINDKLLNLYQVALDFSLKHRFKTFLAGILCLFGTVALFVMIPKDFLPADDLGFILGFSQAKDGTSPYKMIDLQKEAAEMINEDPNVEKLVSAGAQPFDNQGLFFIALKPYNQRLPMPEVIRQLQEKTYDVAGLQAFFRPNPLINLDIGTQTSMGNYQYTLQSLSGEELYEKTAELIEEMKKLPGFSQVTSDMHMNQPQLNLHIQRDRAFDLNISAQTIEQAFSYAYSGNKISTINGDLNSYDVILETIPNAYKDPSVLSKLYLSSQNLSPVPTTNEQNTSVNPNGTQIPLLQIAEVQEGVGPMTINHLNLLNSVTVSFDLINQPLGTAITMLNQLADRILPSQIMRSVQGAADVFQQAFADLNVLLLIAIFVIYVVLGILYENFIHPLSVLSALPPAALGALITLQLFGYPLSLYSFVGIILLIGIVLKNGILMVDFANIHIRQGKHAVEAIRTACLERFRPIIMTTFAALMGAVPIALGIGGLTAQSRKPLGLAIVGGLLISQVLTLFLTPIIFIYLEKMREISHRFANRLSRKDSQSQS